MDLALTISRDFTAGCLPILSASVHRARRMTPKVVWNGTHRCRSFDDSLRLIAPFMSRAGITRVADVTGLDHIGIPVVAVMRPNSRSICVTNGKGLSLDAARVSGIMEAVEFFHAEEPVCALRLATLAQLASEEQVCDLQRLPPFPRLSGPLNEASRLLWSEARDLATGTRLFVPFDLVHLDLTLPPPPGSGYFPVSSNGLASGNTKAEAILHALTELIERDARTLFFLSGAAARAARRLPASALDLGTPAADLLQRLDRADISVAIWDITTDVGVPCVLAAGLDRTDNPMRRVPIAYGSGCHVDLDVALCRALTEVAQTRLTNISGSRDDITSGEFDHTRSDARVAQYRRELDDISGGATPIARSCPRHGEFEADLVVLSERLSRAGLPGVAIVDLSRPGWPFAVVRVVVPGLEPLLEMSHYCPGPRGQNPGRHLET